MNEIQTASFPAKHIHLWLLAGPPVIWIVHFVLSYATAALWCAKYAGPGGSLDGAQVAIAWYTGVALVTIALVAWDAYRRHKHGGAETHEHEFDSPDDRHRFLGFATLLLAGLSAVATVYVALSAAFVQRCY